ncbi:MAG: hypothetical protein WDW38_010398 [Sanguina aurantia]
MDTTKFRPTSAANSSYWTTNSGAPVWNNNSSLTAGVRGPILLEDYHLVEKLAQFDRERIPERVVHARGASAKGFFEVTHDISHLTCADLIRDPRGFAVKFYTREGNWDLVGNNFPVFFVRDGMKFPDMVHALKPNPKSHLQEDWRIVDFFSHHPEAMHMFTFLQDDVGVPLNYRHMPGFGVHTFKMVNRAGKETFVKFHWIPKCGTKNMLEAEAITTGGSNHSHATQDLIESIAAGDYPEWTLAIQTLELADEDKFDFDPLDVTKLVTPLSHVPTPLSHAVTAGIQYSDDKMLQTRLFSYPDSQRHRLGPNYLLLPVNAPKCAYHNNHHEGAMNTTFRDEEVNYFPSRFDPVRHAAPVPTYSSAMLSGRRERAMIPKENNFQQPGQRFRAFDAARQARFVDRMGGMLSHPRITNEIRRIWVGYLSQCDSQLGHRIAAKLQACGAL